MSEELEVNVIDKVTEKVAESDFYKWIAAIKPPKRIVKDGEKTTRLDIIEKIMSGDLVVGDGGILTLKLSEPLTGARSVDSLDFRIRFKTHEIRKQVKRIEDGDRYGMLMAHAQVLTGVEVQVLGMLEKSDFNIISAIVSYFL